MFLVSRLFKDINWRLSLERSSRHKSSPKDYKDDSEIPSRKKRSRKTATAFHSPYRVQSIGWFLLSIPYLQNHSKSIYSSIFSSFLFQFPSINTKDSYFLTNFIIMPISISITCFIQVNLDISNQKPVIIISNYQQERRMIHTEFKQSWNGVMLCMGSVHCSNSNPVLGKQ